LHQLVDNSLDLMVQLQVLVGIQVAVAELVVMARTLQQPEAVEEQIQFWAHLIFGPVVAVVLDIQQLAEMAELVVEEVEALEIFLWVMADLVGPA
jgi:hypothetical protein